MTDGDYIPHSPPPAQPWCFPMLFSWHGVPLPFESYENNNPSFQWQLSPDPLASPCLLNNKTCILKHHVRSLRTLKPSCYRIGGATERNDIEGEADTRGTPAVTVPDVATCLARVPDMWVSLQEDPCFTHACNLTEDPKQELPVNPQNHER